MSLTDKLRELLAIPTGLMAQPIDWDSVDLELSRSDAETLLAEAERLEAQNARLRELVREAYTESWGELSPNEYREEYWEKSQAKAALDKEGGDA